MEIISLKRGVLTLTVLLSLGALNGCVESPQRPLTGTDPYSAGQISQEIGGIHSHLLTQDDTAGIEEQDRIARFRRLSAQNAINAPKISEDILPPGSVDFMRNRVPVVRVVFQEKAFFAFDSDVPLPTSLPILDVIAQNMRHDVPDAALTVLGHTDAIGTDAYNIDLSKRRAAAVMRALVARGVNPAQLTEVAIGKNQPIAPNSTENGRALNRRVEFLISAGTAANLAAVQQYVPPAGYLAINQPEDVTQRTPGGNVQGASAAMVYGYAGKADQTRVSSVKDAGLAAIGGLKLNKATTTTVKKAELLPVAPVKLLPPAEVTQASLSSDAHPHSYQ